MDGWPDGKLHGWIKTALSAGRQAGRLSSSSSVGSRWKAFNLWENFRLRFFFHLSSSSHATLSWVINFVRILSLARCYRLLDQTTSSNVVTVVAAAVSSWLGDTTIVPVAWSIAPCTANDRYRSDRYREFSKRAGVGFHVFIRYNDVSHQGGTESKLQDPERWNKTRKK